MPAISQDIEMWAGDSKIVTIVITDLQNNPVDLTGAICYWWCGRSVHTREADMFIKKSSNPGGGIILLENPSGGPQWDAVFTLYPSDTDFLPPGTYYHEAEVIDGSGFISTITIGAFILHPTMITPLSGTQPT